MAEKSDKNPNPTGEIETGRPKRVKKRPEHLKDYVTGSELEGITGTASTNRDRQETGSVSSKSSGKRLQLEVEKKEIEMRKQLALLDLEE